MTSYSFSKSGWRWMPLAVTIVSTLAVLTACNTSRLLDVTAPSQVPVELFDKPSNAPLMVNSAVGDFNCAFGAFVVVEGLISDELADAQLGAAAWPYDRRDFNIQTNGIYGTNGCDNNQNPGVYVPLSTSRFTADTALGKLMSWTDAQVPNRQTLIATAATYAGFSYALLGMAMCEAAFNLGPQVNQQAIFALAETRFTTAITAATAAGASASDFLNAARVGRARVRLFQGNKTGAAADAALVPAGFVLNAAAGSNDNRSFDRVFQVITQNGFYTVQAESRALTTGGVIDPRSKVNASTTRPADAKSAIFSPARYTSQATPLPIATYDEAQLILAEAQGGAAAVTIINATRARYGLPLYT
ncbi:MAG: hypothetical protein M3081_07660, partial [Gemmatimonadota bacterium]|nr:hypothetical protein [Gemmatimonadota bacterium]